MDPNVLREQLVKLHEELDMAEHVDPRSAQLLGEVMADIKRLLEPSAAVAGNPAAPVPAAASAAAARMQPQSLPDRLEMVAVQFELRHPTLAASSRRLVDMLGKVGL